MRYSEQVKQLVETCTDLKVHCILPGAYNSRNLALIGTMRDKPALLIYRDWMERYPDIVAESIHELVPDDEFKLLGTGDYVYNTGEHQYVCLRTYTIHNIDSEAAMLCHAGVGEFAEMPYKGAVVEDGSMGIEYAADADAAAFSMGVNEES